MQHAKMTREQAIAACGSEVVKKLDSENCDYTGRLQTDGDTSVEFSASVKLPNEHEYSYLVAYYYQSKEALESMEDLSSLDWTIAGYELG